MIWSTIVASYNYKKWAKIMGIDNQSNISGEWPEEHLGAEAGVPPQFHVKPSATGEVQSKSIPTHPVLKADENEEHVLGI